MILNINERKGMFNFQIIWISTYGALTTEHYDNYKEALDHYKHLKTLGRDPALYVGLDVKK